MHVEELLWYINSSELHLLSSPPFAHFNPSILLHKTQTHPSGKDNCLFPLTPLHGWLFEHRSTNTNLYYYSSMTTYRVQYGNPDVYFQNGDAVNNLIEQDIGHFPIQTKSIPPQFMPLSLSQSTCAKLRGIPGVLVTEVGND